MAYVIFDLDGTVICSKHRAITKEDGSLDLENWLANCTQEKIFGDSLLPLAKSMRMMYAAGHTIIVCTARTAGVHDFAFLEHHELRYHHILYRHKGDMRADQAMKISKLNALARELGYRKLSDMNAICFDDNLKVLDAMRANRVTVIDATRENARLAA